MKIIYIKYEEKKNTHIHIFAKVSGRSSTDIIWGGGRNKCDNILAVWLVVHVHNACVFQDARNVTHLPLDFVYL